MQNKAETALAENCALKKACQAAETAEQESREKSTMAEVSDWSWSLQFSVFYNTLCVVRCVRHVCVCVCIRSQCRSWRSSCALNGRRTMSSLVTWRNWRHTSRSMSQLWSHAHHSVVSVCDLIDCRRYYCNVWCMCLTFRHWREKYQELLSNFNKLQSETSRLQQLVQTGSVTAKTTEAQLKVWLINKMIG